MRRAAIVLTLILLQGGWWTSQAGAQGLPATITSVSNQPTSGYVMGADKEGIIVSAQADGGNSFKMPYQNIKDYVIEEPKGWANALANFQSGNFTESEKDFMAFSQALDKLVPLRDSYGSQARFYYLESLKQLGKYRELATALDAQLANPMVLGEAWQSDIDDLQGWAILGKQDWAAMTAYLKNFEDKDAQKSLPLPPFKKELSRARLASLSYLRAVREEAEGRKDNALLEYHGALTLDFGSNRQIFGSALLGALRLVNEKLQAAPDNLNYKKMGYSLAVTYQDVVGKGQVPPEYAKLLEKPPEPPPMPVPEQAKEDTTPKDPTPPPAKGTETGEEPAKESKKGKQSKKAKAEK